MIWNQNKECMSRDEMSALQGKRLHKVVEYVYHNVPFYRKKLQERDLIPDDIQTIEDITKLPYTTKKDLRDNYPTGLQAAPMSQIIRVHASSGMPVRLIPKSRRLHSSPKSDQSTGTPSTMFTPIVCAKAASAATVTTENLPAQPECRC